MIKILVGLEDEQAKAELKIMAHLYNMSVSEYIRYLINKEKKLKGKDTYNENL